MSLKGLALKCFVCAVVGLALSQSAVAQSWVQWKVADGGNGHWYKAVHAPGGITYSGAEQGAAASGGYLATITSATENDFVFGLIQSPLLWFDNGADWWGPWLGGKAPLPRANPGDGWGWVTGESWSYANWYAGLPDNYNLIENRLHYMNRDPVPGKQWNDMPDFWAVPPSYIIERNTSPHEDWVQWKAVDGGNGHWYKAISAPGGISWTEAHADAAAWGGYLATPTSASENSFVFGLIDKALFWNTYIGPWIGGAQAQGSAEPAGGWQWVTNEPWSYANWGIGEPNNAVGTVDENRLHFNGFPSNDPSSTWNDLENNNAAMPSLPVIGFVIERNTSPHEVWVQWKVADGGNGHWYRAIGVPSGITWVDAQAVSVAAGGYLATPTSQAENDFIFELANEPQYWGTADGSWLGGTAPTPRSNPIDGWQWITGEPWAYTNWMPTRPNNTGGVEDRIVLITGNVDPSLLRFWDDRQGSAPIQFSFVTERNDHPQTPLAKPNSYNLDAGSPLSVAAPGVLGNDEPNGGTAVLVDGARHAAAFALGPDGSFDYTPSPGFAGYDRFKYKVANGAGDSSTVTVALNVYPVLATLGANRTTFVGGFYADATVGLNVPAPAGGILVSLSSSDVKKLVVPSSAAVKAGLSSKKFRVATYTVLTKTTATMSATYRGVTKTVSFLLLPGGLQSLRLSPASVVAGSGSTGTVLLSSPAPASGRTVQLSSDSTFAQVPASVTVPAGAVSATFPITTTSVASPSTAKITARLGYVQRRADLTVNP